MYLAVADDCQPEALAQLRHLGPGDGLVLRFSVPTSGGTPGFEIRATVVWAAAGKLGIAFSGDYPEAVTALVGTAKGQGCERFPGPTIDPVRGSAAALPPRPILQAIVGHCQPLALDALTESCKRCFDKLDQDLFQATLGSKSNQEQTPFLDAMILVRGQRQRLGQDILARVAHDLERLAQGKPPLACSIPGTGTAPGKESLSLVTKEDLEDFLALSNVVARLEIHLKAPLLPIERGLALLLSCPPEKLRNPLAPANLCHVFSSVFQSLRIVSPQIELAYQAWETALLERLGELYAKIEERFMEQGIVPHAEARRPVARSAPRIVRAREWETEPGGMHPGRPASSGKRGAGRLSTERSTSTVPRGGNTEVAAGAVFNDIDWDPVDSSGDLAPPPHKLAALESLAAVLRGQTPGASHPTTVDLTRAATRPPATAGAAFYTAPQIRDALIRLQETGAIAQDPGAPDDSFTERLVGALAAQDGPPDRSFRPQDLRTIEIVSRLVPALAQGDRVGHSRASQIERIAPHLYHTALCDPSFLSDPEHPTRRLLETLMRLQAGAPEDAWREIESAVTVLVQGNADDTLGGPSAVSNALEALQCIDKTRQARHAQNLREFITGCEAQQAFLRSRHQLAKRESSATAPSTPPPSHQPQAWTFWLDRARRLQIGDALQFSKGTQAGQRLELAWVGDGHSPLMFVDAEGKRAGSWTLQELAMLLRTDAASLADPAARSPVDRAFQSVLHSLFSDLCQQAIGGATCETTPTSRAAHEAAESSPEPESGEGLSQYPPPQPAPDWAACLKQALDGEALELWFQPIESQISRSVMGLRLVPRIRFAGQVLHPPEETEDEELTARLRELGRRVIRDTLGWLAARSEGWQVEILVIALSPIQLTDPLLIEYTIERLMESTVPPSKLCFELAEATVLAHPMEVLHAVGTLRELGCRILISGLGGRGALGDYLSRVSADFLAVDRRFIAGMVTRPHDLAVVKSSQEMARTLGRKMLAEGVESDEQGRIIGDLGIDYLVGPLRPPPHLHAESG
ncbi:MAG: DUF1631 family protein [Gammaproteobacteria bacterium]